MFFPCDDAASFIFCHVCTMQFFLALTQVFHTCQNIRNLDVYRQKEAVALLTQQLTDLATKQITKI